MGDQNTVDLPERLWQNLLTEIRAAINEQAGLFRLHQHRATGTLILRVCTLTDLALAAYHWHTTGCSRSQKRQFHLLIYDLRIYYLRFI